jgi:hypothetical protein
VSSAPRSAAIDALSALDVVFYAIELQGFGLDSAALAELTAAADGQVIEAEDADALSAIYDDIATQVVSQHIVEYDTARGGATVLEVLLTVDGVTYANSLTFQLPAAPDSSVPTTSTTAAPRPRRRLPWPVPHPRSPWPLRPAPWREHGRSSPGWRCSG